jgi:ribosome modulation factor
MAIKSNPFDGNANRAFIQGREDGLAGRVIKNPFGSRSLKIAAAWVKGWEAGDAERKLS